MEMELNFEEYFGIKDFKLDQELDEIVSTLNQYKPTEVFFILNSLIINNTINSMKNHRNTTSPKLANSLFYLYKKNCSVGYKKIKNKEKLINYLSDKLNKINYYYSNIFFEQTKEKEIDSDFTLKSFYNINFNTFHFDYPNISSFQYLKCFLMNKEIINDMVKDHNLDFFDVIKGWLICILYENIADINDNNKYKYETVFTSFSEKIILELLYTNKINHRDFLEYFFPKLESKTKIIDSYPTDKFYKEKFSLGIRYNNRVYYPRSFYQFNDFWDMMLENKLMENKKGDFLEEYTYNLLVDFFGKENVFMNLFDENGNEQDFIVIYNDYLLCFECKSENLKEPFRDVSRAEKRMRQNFKSSIQKAYEQGLRIKNNIENNSTRYYDDDTKSTRKLIIDLKNFDSQKVLITCVTLENYLNLSNRLNKYLKPTSNIYPWVIDIFSLEHIFNKIISIDKSPQYLINYISERINTHNYLQAIGAEELECFGYYLRYNKFMDFTNLNTIMTLGNGYSSFVLDYFSPEIYILIDYFENLQRH